MCPPPAHQKERFGNCLTVGINRCHFLDLVGLKRSRSCAAKTCGKPFSTGCRFRILNKILYTTDVLQAPGRNGRWARVPNQYNRPPSPTLTTKCWPRLHATQYRYLGEKTVQMNKCVRRAVHAAMTDATLAVAKTVRSVTWRR